MGLGVAKVDKYAVAQILRHKTTEPAHSFRDAFVIGRDEFSQVFRIHPSRECGRTNEVREHHCDLPALSSVRRSWRGRRRGRTGNRGRDLLAAFEIGNRTQ